MLYSGAWRPGEKAASSPKADSPLSISREEFLNRSQYIREGGGYMPNSTVSSDDHLEIVLRGLIGA